MTTNTQRLEIQYGKLESGISCDCHRHPLYGDRDVVRISVYIGTGRNHPESTT